MFIDHAEGGGGAAHQGAAIAVVIPSFRASRTITDVVGGIGAEVTAIYVVDDCCPEGTGDQLKQLAKDSRINVVRHSSNLGVGAATKTGYRHALADGADIIVKMDADGQMNPSHIMALVAPIVARHADYAKGTRFAPGRAMPAADTAPTSAAMPFARRAANLLLSRTHRLATGYSDVRDPANGFTAIHARTLRLLDLDRVAACFFFETDMLHHLNEAGATVREVPLPARYGGPSTLRLWRVAPRFALLLSARIARRLWKRKRIGDRRQFSPEPLWCRSRSS